jgi:hypothetical protein
MQSYLENPAMSLSREQHADRSVFVRNFLIENPRASNDEINIALRKQVALGGQGMKPDKINDIRNKLSPLHDHFIQAQMKSITMAEFTVDRGYVMQVEEYREAEGVCGKRVTFIDSTLIEVDLENLHPAA